MIQPYNSDMATTTGTLTTTAQRLLARPLWWWPPAGSDRERLFVAETLDVVGRVAWQAKAGMAGRAWSWDLAGVDDDLEDYLLVRAFEFRDQADPGRWSVNEPLLEQWCRVLYAVLTRQARWRIAQAHQGGKDEHGRWRIATSVYAPASDQADKAGDATVGDRGRWLWDSGEPDMPEDHLLALERLRDTARTAVLLDGGPVTPERVALRDRLDRMGWEQVMAVLDGQVPDEGQRQRRRGQCVEFGCQRTPREGRARCSLHEGQRQAEKRRAAASERGEVCSVEGCDRPRGPRGLCRACYEHQRTHGGLAPLPRARDLTCTADGCDRPQEAKGLCSRHYEAQRWARRKAEREQAGGQR